MLLMRCNSCGSFISSREYKCPICQNRELNHPSFYCGDCKTDIDISTSIVCRKCNCIPKELIVKVDNQHEERIGIEEIELPRKERELLKMGIILTILSSIVAIGMSIYIVNVYLPILPLYGLLSIIVSIWVSYFLLIYMLRKREKRRKQIPKKELSTG